MLMSKDAIGEVSADDRRVTDFYQPTQPNRVRGGHQTVLGLPAGRRRAGGQRAARRKAIWTKWVAPTICIQPGRIGSDRRKRHVSTPNIVHQRAILRNVIAAGTKIAQLGYTGRRLAGRRRGQPRAGRGLRDVRGQGAAGLRRRSAPVVARRARPARPVCKAGDVVTRGVPTGFRDIDDADPGPAARPDGRRGRPTGHGQVHARRGLRPCGGAAPPD